MQLPIVSIKLRTLPACVGATGARKITPKMAIEAPGRNDLRETTATERDPNVERMRKRSEASRRRGALGWAANEAKDQKWMLIDER